MYQNHKTVRVFDLTQPEPGQRESELADSMDALRESLEDCTTVMLGLAIKMGVPLCR